MARKVETIVTLTDDLDGGKADQTVTLGLNGTTVELDLSNKNLKALEKLVTPYLEVGRRVRQSRGRSSSRGSSSNSKERLTEIREWARTNGYDVSERGRIAGAVVEAYDAAH